MPNKPKVAVKCLVYNHEPFLRDCLKGFVMQQTDFPFVAIVHDDASTDHSADIIREYAAKYPEIIHPIYETENQYSKQDGSITKIMNDAVSATGAPYIAMCEGDDYWTDPHKLQKQVAFLDAHEEYSMCFHNVEIESNQQGDFQKFAHLETRDFTAKEIYERWTVPTCSVIYRSVCRQSFKQAEHILFGDIFLFLNLAQLGKLYCINEKMGVYRRHEAGLSFSLNANKAILLTRQYMYMAQCFCDDLDIVAISRKKALDYCYVVMYNLSDVTKKQKLKMLPVYQKLREKHILSFSTLSYIYTYIIKRR